MAMKYVVEIVVLLLACVAVTPLFARPGNIHVELEIIGSIEGKTFYSETTLRRNWFEARELCNASDLELATIDTQSQYEMLKYNGSIGADYWTAGRDAQLPRQFSWDSTNTQPLETFDWFPVAPYQTCVGIYIGLWSTNGRVYMIPCTNSLPGTLCQTKNAK